MCVRVAWGGAPGIVTVILRLETASRGRGAKSIVQKLIQHFKSPTLEYIGKGRQGEMATFGELMSLEAPSRMGWGGSRYR